MKPAVAEENATQRSVDYALLLRQLEQKVILGREPEKVAGVLARASIWRRLAPEQALQWARLAQTAGLPEVSLEVLGWLNEQHPDFQPAWQQRVELLEVLGADRGANPHPVSPHGETVESGPTGDPPSLGSAVPAAAGGDSAPWESAVAEPFLQLRRQDEGLELFLRTFRGREDCFARQWADKKAGTQGYVPVRRPLEAADVLDHLRGLKTYGIYLLQQDSHVRLAVIDADLAPRLRDAPLKGPDRDLLQREKNYLLKRLTELSSRHGLPALVEFSGGKGFHFWYFFAEPVAAATARAALQQLVKTIAGDLSCFNLEVFPKQDRLDGKGLGNLVKLPLGLHRLSGRQSFFLHLKDRSSAAQLELLKSVRWIPKAALDKLLSPADAARVVEHPRRQQWSGEFPELALLSERCLALAQIIAVCQQARTLSLREEKILFGVLGFLPRARTLLHHLLQHLPEYNAHLVDYRLSRVRGSPLGCRRIHGLLNLSTDYCAFAAASSYAHPLLHMPNWTAAGDGPKAERIVNLRDALAELQEAIAQVRRFLPPHER